MNPEYIESEFGDMICNPKYTSNTNNEIQNIEAQLKQYEEVYVLINIDFYDNNDYDDDNHYIDIQEVETKLKQCREEYKTKNEYYTNILDKFKTNYNLTVSDQELEHIEDNQILIITITRVFYCLKHKLIIIICLMNYKVV
jgi:hypothetical protein